MQRLKDKVAVITGGGYGIGYAITELFSSEGAKVAIFGRNEDKLKSAIEKIDGEGIYVKGDVKNVSDIANLYSETEKKFGKVDIIVANAGVALAKNAADVTEDDFDHLVDINYKGVYFTVQQGIKYLQENASVILVSSIWGHSVIEGRTLYASTKAALGMLARSFAADLIKRKIRVNAMSPGYTNTDLLQSLPKETLQSIIDRIPFGRLAEPSEIAKSALFLASDDSSYMTGSDIIIDGGFTRFQKV